MNRIEFGILCAALVLGAIVLPHPPPSWRLMFCIFAGLLVAMYAGIYWAFCRWFDSQYPKQELQRANKEFHRRPRLRAGVFNRLFWRKS